MAKSKAKAAESQEADAAGGEAQGNGEITKADAVRAAVKAGKVMPSAGVVYIKEKFGLDVSNAAFSSYKNADKNKAGVASVRQKPAAAAGGGSSSGGGRGGDPVVLAKQVKALVEVHGVAAVTDMANLFGR